MLGYYQLQVWVRNFQWSALCWVTVIYSEGNTTNNATAKTSEIALKGKRARLFRNVSEECYDASRRFSMSVHSCVLIDDIAVSIKACAVNFNCCIKEKKPSDCHKYLLNCSAWGAKIQNSSTCENALAELRLSLGMFHMTVCMKNSPLALWKSGGSADRVPDFSWYFPCSHSLYIRSVKFFFWGF